MPEYKAPPRAVPAGDDGYFELLTKSVFQAGFRWSVVESKWPGFLAAFDGFDVAKVAAYTEADVERLKADPGIVRNARKIEATIENAKTMLRLAQAHGSFKAWLDTFGDLPWPARKKSLAAPFKNFGPTGAYVFLWCVGEPVPPYSTQASWTDPVPPGYPEAASQ